MSQMHTLRLFISERLAAALEEIWGMVEITITEEVSSLKHEIEQLHRTAVEPQSFLAVPEEAPHERQHHELEISSRLVKEELMEFTPMKEEEEEGEGDLGSSHVGDQLLEEEEEEEEEGDLIKHFIFNPTCVTSVHNQDQTRSPNLQLRVEDREEAEKLRPKAAGVFQTSPAVSQDDPGPQRSISKSNKRPAPGKTRGPQLGQAGQQVVTQVIRAPPVSSSSSQTQDARAQGSKHQVKISVAQLHQLTRGEQVSQKLLVQGQGGQTTGQLQVIPEGVTVTCGPGQQLMLAKLPDGQAQRFLFTPLLPAGGTPSTGEAGQQVVTQIISAPPVSSSSRQTQEARAQGSKHQVKISLAQLHQLTRGEQKLLVQGQGGQTTGQLQVIPEGVTVTCGPGQELMLAKLPDGQAQRFLFTPLLPAATPSTDFQTTVYQQLSSLTSMLSEVTQSQKELAQSQRDEGGSDWVSRRAVLDALDPAKTEEELQVLEDRLNDKEHQRKMTRYLSAIGGKDLPDVVRRVLSAIATYRVWSFYSVHGMKGKKPLKNMTLYNVILRAVMASKPNATQRDVAAQLQETLKHAPARCKKLTTPAQLTSPAQLTTACVTKAEYSDEGDLQPFL